jgi:DNA recombination protein RmuC
MQIANMQIETNELVCGFALLIGIIFIILFFVQRVKIASLQEANLLVQESVEALENQLNTLRERYQKSQLQRAVIESKYEQEIASSQEKLELLQNAKDELSREFSNLSNKIFQEKNKEFSSLNKEQLELFLKPFREQVGEFAKRSREQFEVELKERHLLKSELKRLEEMNAQLAQEALNLTKALKGENKTQGNWGELVLENILEHSGLRKGSEYELQKSLKDGDGKRYQPDVIIHMPDNRDIIVDAKVSLRAYERYINAEDENEKRVALKEHLNSISRHIKELSNKKYEALESINTLDFVLMFMPIEGAFLLALKEDGEFFKHAFEENILVVSPSTLLVTLRTIEHIWRTKHQQEHAKKIAKEAEAMVEKLILFVEEMQNFGIMLQKTQESYDKAMNRLSTGRGNVIKRAQNIVKLGIKTKKELPLVSEDDT